MFMIQTAPFKEKDKYMPERKRHFVKTERAALEGNEANEYMAFYCWHFITTSLQLALYSWHYSTTALQFTVGTRIGLVLSLQLGNVLYSSTAMQAACHPFYNRLGKLKKVTIRFFEKSLIRIKTGLSWQPSK